MEQRSDEWFTARLGKVTASRVADIMARTKSGYSASRAKYMAQLLCERLTGQKEDSYQSAAMQRGTELEGKARAVYLLETGNDVTETGLVDHPTIAMSAASPDGLVNDDGLIEIKCPETHTHLEFIKSGKPKSNYMQQMQWQMACTGRQWCDFVSYDDRLPEYLAYKCVRIPRDDALIAEMEAEVSEFLAELDLEVKQLGAMKHDS